MKKRIKLLAAWKCMAAGAEKEYAKDTVLEVDLETAKTLCGEGTAIYWDEASEVAAKAVKDADDARVTKAVSDAITASLKANQSASPSLSIEIKDKSDADPFHGFAGVHPPEKLTKGQRGLIFGKFCKEVFEAGAGNKPSELLAKSLARSKDMLTKAAGTGLTVASDEDVGYLMPPALSIALMQSEAEVAVIRPRAGSVAMTTQSVDLPKGKNYDHSSGAVHGGVIAYWEGEDDLLTETKGKLEKISLKLKMLAALGYASKAAMRFAPISIGSYLFSQFADAITFAEEDAFINGGGAGKPLGLLNGPGKLEISKETGQSAATIVFNNIVKMWSRLKVFNGNSVVWLANRDTFPQLATMSLVVGTAGVPVWLPAGGLSGSPFETLMGRPLLYTDHCSVLGTAGDLILADLSRYLIADDQQGAELATSMHLKFDYAQEAFRIIKFVDAQPVDTAVFTPHKGNTKSPIVSLATRS